jgi:hypothetical protein
MVRGRERRGEATAWYVNRKPGTCIHHADIATADA